MIIIYFIPIAVFIVLGVLFCQGKGAGFIAGYNTLSDDEKSEYDEKALCRFIGREMFAAAVCWIPILIGEIFNVKVLFWIGMVLFVLILVFGLIYVNTGNRFKNKI
ncbi:MAG: DUF3784 domain-containing protein [Firmicutes bacterium]|nr:DUF3784 domain-containing protein [Bacillota bacterium]